MIAGKANGKGPTEKAKKMRGVVYDGKGEKAVVRGTGERKLGTVMKMWLLWDWHAHSVTM
jgi:hypothetical protein